MSTYRCQYCKKSTEQFKPIIEHLISDHDDKEMKFLKQFRSAIRTNNFRIIPKQCQNEGRSITILSEEDKIHVSRKTIFIPESPLKKIQKEDVNAASTNSLSAEYQQYSAESDEIEHADEIDDDVMSDSAENDNDMEEMISLLPIVMEELKKANKLEEYISFHRLVSESKFPLQNIAYLLFNDVVRWFSLEQSSHMRYSNEVKLFWRTGLRLFHGKFLRFMGGSKGTGQIVNKQSTPGLCSTTTSNINFVVPNRNALAEEKKFVNESKPGIFNEMIKSLADSDFTDNTKTYKVCVDGKKINLSSNGEVDLWGYEDKPTKEEKNERTKREIELVIRLKEHALKQIAFGHVFTHDCNLESKILIPELCTEIVTILSDRLKDLRLLKVKKNLFLNSLLEKSGSNWQKSHLVMVISSMKTTLYSIQNLIEDLLQVIGTLCKFASQMLQSDMNYSTERFVQMNTQSNFVCLSNGERDLTDPSLVKQRSHQWHELRKNYTVTGSTIQAAIGLNGIKKQKEYLENKEKGNQQENDVQLQSRFEHGNKNEPNAVATIVSKFLPAFYPHLSFYEEGCYELTDKDTSLLVSPDGSLRDPKIESRIEFGVEIKCPLPGKLYTTDVHYSIPWYYVPQILSEMNALNVKSLFFVSYSMESTTIQHAHFDEPIWNNIQSEIRIVNLGQRQKILKERILPLKQKIMEYCKTKVKLVAEVPSCNAVPCSHKESDEEHRLYHSPSERSENSALCLSQIERTCLKISNLIKDCHTLCAIKASEVLVFLLSDLDRTYKAAIPHAMPIAYALKGFSMKTDAMQKMICDVRKALFINGMYTPIVSFDGQWSKLAFQKSTDEPLTLLELQKKVYNKVKRKTTSELRSIIFHSGEINANTFEEIRCKVHYEKGKNGITVGYNENQSFIKTSIHLHGILRELKVKSSPIESTVNTQCNIPIEEVISDLPANVIASIDDDFMDELAVVNVQSLDRHEQERREMPDTDYCDLQNLFTEDPVVNSCLDQMSRRNETDGNKDSKMDFENIADQCTGTGDEETQQIQDEPTISDHILEMIFPKLQHSKWARKWTIDTVSFLSIMKTKSSISAKFTIPELICFAEAYNEFGYEKIKVYKSWNKDRIVEEIYKACTSIM
ncbi:hypothetical protein FSP39_025021 [Pinctada imbricata]|uniref:YqaJ viral recombinase domain-containing protein n=1 Tax=Pinctada imbricata TaxID=66713 RepID=A0AA89CBA5_PINIB|nr:hypothetical protein FSP39_025021 [Pinctada imbricata]